MPADPNINRFTPSLEGPLTRAAAVTPSDADELDYVTRGISVNVDGNVSLVFMHGGTVTVALMSGAIYPLRVKQVRATSTTATGIVAYW